MIFDYNNLDNHRGQIEQTNNKMADYDFIYINQENSFPLVFNKLNNSNNFYLEGFERRQKIFTSEKTKEERKGKFWKEKHKNFFFVFRWRHLPPFKCYFKNDEDLYLLSPPFFFWFFFVFSKDFDL